MKRKPKPRQKPSEKGVLKSLLISQIRRDGTTQMRVRTDPAVVAEYAADMNRGDNFPPPKVIAAGADYLPYDGIHTIGAAELAGRRLIKCEVRQGTLRDAILLAAGANSQHGMRRTNEDKRRAVVAMFSDDEWRRWSDREIARRCAVTQPFVSALRKGQSDNGYHSGGAVEASADGSTAASADALPLRPSGLQLLASQPVDSPIKWHGGKQPLAAQIIPLMPAHTTYCEPYCGGLGVLLAKRPDDVSEIVNDLHSGLTNFWSVLRDEPAGTFDRFVRMVTATPVCEDVWRAAEADLDAADLARRAWAFFVRNRQSMAGRMEDFSPLSFTRTRRAMNEQVSAWWTAVKGLPAVCDRLMRVAILNRDALDVIRQHDGPETLFYVDPPYAPESRTTPKVYAHEMTTAQHRRLLDAMKGCAGKVILSGYASALYDRELAGWHRREIDRANSAASGDIKRRMTEVLWCNFTPPAVAAERKSA